MNNTLLKYPGSKNKIADKIIALFPDGYQNMTYLEPFFGSGTVFFRKAPSVIETINDLNEDIYNLFLQIRENSSELARLIEYTPWSRQELEESVIRTESGIENARRFLVRCWFTIGSDGNKGFVKYSWSHNIKANNGNIAAFEKLPMLIHSSSERLRPKANNIVQIENRDAFSLIEKYNRENVLMYLDPPYVLQTRKNTKHYFHEMTNEDHIRLCDLINKSKAKIVLSGYANDIYEKYLSKLRKTSISTYDQKGNKRTEILWTNYIPIKELFDFEEYLPALQNEAPCA